MNIKHLLLLATLICSTNTHSMEKETITHANNQDTFLSLPQDIWTYLIAHHHIKDDIRKTCKYLHSLASSTNTTILTHPSLQLSEKALERYLLYHAAMGDTAIVRNLLAIDADPNTCDDKQMTAMHYAAQYGHVEIVDMLLQHPALITTDIAKDEKSPWCLALKRDQNIVIKNIFLTCKLHPGSALRDATDYGALNSLHTLLACNIDINTQSEDCYYPLIAAVYQRHAHLVKFLITKGAHINCRSKNKINIDATPLHFATRDGYTDIAQLLIDYGADVNLKEGIFNFTPLHVASKEGHIEIVKIILSNDADINATDKNDKTPLDVAKNDEIKQLLIAYGGKTGAQLKPIEVTQNVPEKENDNCVMQ